MGRERLNDFYQCLEYSLGSRQEFDISLLISHIPDCVSVEKTDVETDKSGIDYIATLRDGSQVTIDAKTRKAGATRYWKHGEPELALERYSVVEKKIVGWLLKDSKTHPDYILYTFDRRDTDKYYFIPYLLLRKVAYRNGRIWRDTYGLTKQPNHGYYSDAIFVPASVVLKAVYATMCGQIPEYGDGGTCNTASRTMQTQQTQSTSTRAY